MHNSTDTKLPEPSLFALKFSGSFDIPAETFRLINDEDTFMFVVVGHLVGENRAKRANGETHWAGRMKIDDATRVADPNIANLLFEQLGLAGYQGELDELFDTDSGDQIAVTEPELDMGEPATPVPTPTPAATPPPAAPPAPPPMPPRSGSDKVLDAFLYGGGSR